ncbi:MAG: hypothetical protein JST16_11840 [Bdellovibrionales bacterium]|nr:hypothetical protein [Bdellovibrionales bacterium]
MTKSYERPVKANQHRIQLLDGRELQYHPPFKQAAPLSLVSLLPEKRSDWLEIEIGPGKGEFLARRAAQYPDRYFVGIDRRADRTDLTRRKLERMPDAGANWMVLREDARGFLEAGLPSIQVFHIYHPDPWPKTRHHKHRFFRSPDAKRWAEAIVSGGEYRLSTDHREYFEEMIDIVNSWGLLRLEFLYRKTHELGEAQSHFEGIFLNKREPVYKAYFRKL